MIKKNLVIVHSFPTNSILLKGLYEFLSDFFDVYFVDLPGFNTNVAPMKEISFDNYSTYVNNYINGLNLKDYYLGGVSFGFYVVNNCRIDNRCKGLLAIEPYIGTKYLKQGFLASYLLKIFVLVTCGLKLHNAVYRSKLFEMFLLIKNPKTRIDVIVSSIDGYTFFETAKLIVENNLVSRFHNKPYILVINEKDSTIFAPEIINMFERLNDVLIVKTTSEHFPKCPSKKYFQKSVSSGSIEKMLRFVNR